MKMKKTADELLAILTRHAEWFCTDCESQRTTPLLPGDWMLETKRNEILFSYWSERGPQMWSLFDWRFAERKLFLTATGLTSNRQQPTSLMLVPRVSVAEEIESLRAARLAALARFVELVRETFPRTTVRRASLSQGAHTGGLLPGREARLILQNMSGERIALTGMIEIGITGEKTGAFLSSALLWFLRSSQKIHRLRLVSSAAASEDLVRLAFLLRDSLSRMIEIYEINDARDTLTRCPALTRDVVFAIPSRSKLFVGKRSTLTDSTLCERLVALAPEAIDVVFARHGATLRFHGLPFARLRRILNREAAWFGLSREHSVRLTEATWPDLMELVESLKLHRNGHAPDQRHAFFAAAGEAWLESLLRRDIKRLDPNLIASPLYAQLRARSNPSNKQMSSRPIDLFGLRQDGRLVLIELKVTEDRDMVLQGVDYWRRISSYHQAGHISRTRLFGDAKIGKEPPLLYLAAPVLRFHRTFQTLASAVAPEIEMYRFDLNEDWRTGVRVMRRTRVN